VRGRESLWRLVYRDGRSSGGGSGEEKDEVAVVRR
jgi:hypothetical protein